MEPNKEETEGSEKERMKAEDLDEEEDKKDEKKKKKGKTESGENPEEGSASGTDANSSTSPGMSTPSATQSTSGNNSGVEGARMASGASSAGQSPSDVSYTGKSATPDLMKSPVFVKISEQLEAMQNAVEKKFEAISKSFNDRIDNMLKEIANTEKAMKDFYSKSFYKAAGENVSPESTVQKSISEQVEEGKVRFSY